MKLFSPITFKSTDRIQQAALQLLQDQWDFKTEKLLRIPMSGELIDEVNDELHGMGFASIAIWTIFARGPGNNQEIHVDAFNADTRVNSGIIIPVLGAIGSKMQWFGEENTNFKSILTPDKKSFFFKNLSREKPILIEELEISSPHLVRLNVPHRAIASSTAPRAVVSIKLVGNPVLI